MTPIPAARSQLSSLLRRRASPALFRAIARATMWALVLTIVSGAAVRLTGSGLGCPTWPTCTAHTLVAPLRYHAWVEFGNRLVNAATTVLAVGAFAAALLRSPRRRDLTWLSAGLVAGLLGEVVLGGVVVLEKLAPPFVAAHFLFGVLFLADAIVLNHRSRLPDTAGPRVRLVGRRELLLGRLLALNAALVISLGTIVTGTGPHAGAPDVPRFHFLTLHQAAQLHGSSAEALLGLTVLTIWLLWRSGAPRPVLRNGLVLLGVILAQAAIGYTQYFLGDPAGFVELHVAGAVTVVAAVLRFNLGLYRRDLPSTEPAALPCSQRTPALSAAAGPTT